MPKVFVVYDSETGNTEKMAKAVVEGVKTVKGVDVELLKAGTAFSIAKLNEMDALILGSPTRYGSVTPEVKALIEAIKELEARKKLQLSGKIGGVFGSYAWDGGWVTDKLAADMKEMGLRIVAPVVSAIDWMGGMGTRIDEASVQKCRELGRTVAEEVVG